MKIRLLPVRMDAPRPSLSVSGDVLTIDGEPFDFSGVPQGATLPAEAVASDFVADDVVRDDLGEIIVTLIFAHGADAPPETRFPAEIAVASGDVDLPPYEREEAPDA